MKKTRMYIAILVGIIFYLLLRYAAESVMLRFVIAEPVTVWTVLSAPINMLITLLPGFIAGWISCKWGILSGFIVGLVGSGSYSVLIGTAGQYVSSDNDCQAVLIASWFLIMCIISGCYSACSGGTAQLVRSSFSPKTIV